MALTLPFLAEGELAARSGAARRVLCEAVRVTGEVPIVFPAAEAGYYGAQRLDHDVPAVTLTTHRHAAVRGRSNLLTTQQGVGRHQLVNLATDVMPEVFYDRLRLSEDLAAATWAEEDRFNVGYLPEAAVFADSLGSNYAHWLTEVLPRVAVFVRETGASVPLIVDAGLHPNIMRSLARVAPAAMIHQLGADHVLHVGVLHNVSAAGYVPFKLKPQALEAIGHGVFAPAALRESVRRLKADVVGGGPRPKLLVRRNAGLRHMENEAEIAEALIARGFQVIEPERLSFDEQVQAYSQARMVVGATGAAMANLMFCPPDCPIVVLMMRFRHTAYWYWRRIAAAAGAGPVIHVSGAQTTELDDPWGPLAAHQNYRIELADVLAAVDAAEVL